MGEFSDIYVMSDVFECFRDVCMRTYGMLVHGTRTQVERHDEKKTVV